LNHHQKDRVNLLLAAYSTAMGSTRRNCLARSFPVCSPYTPQILYLPPSVTFQNHSKLCIAPSLLPKLLCSVRNRSSQVHTSTIPKQIASVPSLCTYSKPQELRSTIVAVALGSVGTVLVPLVCSLAALAFHTVRRLDP